MKKLVKLTCAAKRQNLTPLHFHKFCWDFCRPKTESCLQLLLSQAGERTEKRAPGLG